MEHRDCRRLGAGQTSRGGGELPRSIECDETREGEHITFIGITEKDGENQSEMGASI